MKLADAQKALKVPKTHQGPHYKYRSCEDILEALKPILDDAYVTLSDDIVIKGDRVYVKATATFQGEGGQVVSVDGYAREVESKSSMDSAQITGTASSYARKYALNGLFLIDDTRDVDADQAPLPEYKPTPTSGETPGKNMEMRVFKRNEKGYVNVLLPTDHPKWTGEGEAWLKTKGFTVTPYQGQTKAGSKTLDAYDVASRFLERWEQTISEIGQDAGADKAFGGEK